MSYHTLSLYYLANNDIGWSLKDFCDTPVNDVILAFIVPSPNAPNDVSQLDFDPQLKAQLSPELIKTVQQEGARRVRVALGGEPGHFPLQTWQAIAAAPARTAERLASLCEAYGLDGVDIDFEETGSLNHGQFGVAMLVALTHALYDQLPAERRIITHAPQCPYLYSAGSPDYSGSYFRVMDQAGSEITALNIQYYNNDWFTQPLTTHVAGLNLTPPFGSSLMGIVAQSSIPAAKLIAGFPVMAGDAGSGYQPVASLISDVINPLKGAGDYPFGGIMGWKAQAGCENWFTPLSLALSAG
ncbi:glycosyl hydrolase family 18 protein [Woodsholea maritima]|uniref:glycosyl hydrolase family 18 protein n=1 Tax=Woodsholea maritima TaxID=240237 RepID=UPI00036A3743|nr:glycosyl hydrolase family 18 protein [Woodsholea maritima]